MLHIFPCALIIGRSEATTSQIFDAQTFVQFGKKCDIRKEALVATTIEETKRILLVSSCVMQVTLQENVQIGLTDKTIIVLNGQSIFGTK
jgi:hypothetical protein